MSLHYVVHKIGYVCASNSAGQSHINYNQRKPRELHVTIIVMSPCDRTLFYQALNLLHSNDPDSEKQLLALLQQSSNKSDLISEASSARKMSKQIQNNNNNTKTSEKREESALALESISAKSTKEQMLSESRQMPSSRNDVEPLEQSQQPSQTQSQQLPPQTQHYQIHQTLSKRRTQVI